MTIKTKINIFNIFLVFMISLLPGPVSASNSSIPHSQLLNAASVYDSDENGERNKLSALSLNDSTTFQIVQQPAGNGNFVSPLPNYVTEFQTASYYGVIGLLAHNYLAGQYFFQISPGQEIELIYDDHKEKFVVTLIQKYQALSPNSPISDFISLATGETFTAHQLFRKIYQNQPGNLVLQTCIYANGNPTWGRLFIIAEPVA